MSRKALESTNEILTKYGRRIGKKVYYTKNNTWFEDWAIQKWQPIPRQ